MLALIERQNLWPWLVRQTAQMMDHVTGVADQTRDPDPSDTVQLFVSDELICIEPDVTLRQVAQRLAAEGVGALVVTEGERVTAIISERDVVRAVASGRDLDSTAAADLSTHVVVTCTPDTTVQAAGVS